MPSPAYTGHLLPLLEDAEQLQLTRLSVGRSGADAAGRTQALNRGTVVMCVSAWEAYVEELARAAVATLRPSGMSDLAWAVLTAPANDLVRRFNTPSPDDIQRLLRTTIGLLDIRPSWKWRGADPNSVRGRLADVLTTRHQIAHGVNPRPTVETRPARDLPDFFRRLGRCTDAAVRAYLVGTLGVAHTWPA